MPRVHCGRRKLGFLAMAVVGGGDGMLGDRGLGLVTPMPLQSIAFGCLPSDSGNLGAGRGGGGRGRKDDRIPQWGYHETKEFIAIRAELEKDFTQTKRNKTLWELIAGKMKEKGFRRSADQCKCKWKNLVNRYKGKELSDPENGRQCPFFEELDAIFKARAKNVDKLLLESDGLRPKKKLKQLKRGIMGVNLSDDDSEDDEDEDESEDDRTVQKKKRKADKERQRATAEKYRANSMQEVLEEFFQQQQRMEEQWREALERRDTERRMRDEEWRETMEKLEHERMMREQAWWEHEEERRARDEERSQKRDDLLGALIMKVTHE